MANRRRPFDRGRLAGALDGPQARGPQTAHRVLLFAGKFVPAKQPVPDAVVDGALEDLLGDCNTPRALACCD